MRGWLVDNNVPRSVTLLLVDRGDDAVEVRAVLGQDAPDDAVVAFAAAQERWLITHDRGCARNALGKAFPTSGCVPLRPMTPNACEPNWTAFCEHSKLARGG